MVGRRTIPTVEALELSSRRLSVEAVRSSKGLGREGAVSESVERGASGTADERCKIHDLLIEGVELALKKRGYPALTEMKAKWQCKER
jgi:hypothetical protein